MIKVTIEVDGKIKFQEELRAFAGFAFTTEGETEKTQQVGQILMGDFTLNDALIIAIDSKELVKDIIKA